MTPQEAYSLVLFALAIWREARGELYVTKQAVAWTVRNRVMRGGWWGHTWSQVVLMPFQFSSFNANDPNAHKLPHSEDPSWQDSLDIASKLFDLMATPGLEDVSLGATSYFDASMDPDPPRWSFDGSNVKTVDYGRLRFYKLAV